MISKRTLLAGLVGLICVPGAKPARAALPPVSMERHEQAMRRAIEQGKKNPFYPFGAVITEATTGAVVAEGVNDARSNPTLHGEIVCINDYVARHGNKDWGSKILYTTCEPCPMCITALIWAKIGGVVFASSALSPALVSSIGEPIRISAQDVINAETYHKPMLLGGVLAAETDAMFVNRKRN
jgi:tRNA(Arg) A34 adenosine deaminase TadA